MSNPHLQNSQIVPLHFFQITETFTPPPPSNFGLPDDGRCFHYGTFPELDHDLFGKIRQPIQWHEHNRHSLRLIGRRSSVTARRGEQAVAEKATLSLLTSVTKRGVRSLEAALKALSTPFVDSPRRPGAESRPNGHARAFPNRDRSVSVVSNVTLPSEFDMTEEIVSSAEEVVLNARRKQAILIGIIIKLQAFCRTFLTRNRHRKQLRNVRALELASSEDDDELKIRCTAAVVIQSWRRSNDASHHFAIIRRAVVLVQARRRGVLVCLAYQMLLAVVSKVQAVSRGYVARRRLAVVIPARMNLYRKQIFWFWFQAHAPLVYRTKVWTLLKTSSFTRLALAEQELQRLWKELKIRLPQYSENGAIEQADTLRLDVLLGLSFLLYWKALKVCACITHIAQCFHPLFSPNLLALCRLTKRRLLHL